MKKETEYKYPNSANLFKFCRRVLDHKYGGIRVIDQDVGQILGFDPADCSHWKKGKKNIRSIQAMKSIAGHLGVDEKIVVDVASGDMGELEAYFEFTGYGNFDVDTKVVEAAKKDFYRKYANAWSKEKENEFKHFFHIDSDAIVRKVQEIHEALGFNEAPLYLPEIVSRYPDIMLKPQKDFFDEAGLQTLRAHWEGSQLVIAYKSGLELKPFLRFRIAKAMAEYFLAPSPLEGSDLKPYAKHVQDVESNIFAAHLLAPASLIRQELRQMDPSKDVVVQLAEAFWVSKAFMNQRLKELIAQA